MAMSAPDHPVAARGSLDQIGYQGAKLRWNRVSSRIRHIDDLRSYANHFAEHLQQKIRVAARRILGREFDVVSELLGVAYSLHRRFHDLLPRHSQFVLQMDIGRGDERMDAGVPGMFDGLQSPVDIRFLGARETDYPRTTDFFAHSSHRVEIAVRRGGKARFDHIDAELFQLPGNDYFLFDRHARAGRLLAVTQGRIEYLHHVIGRYLFHCEISS